MWICALLILFAVFGSTACHRHHQAAVPPPAPVVPAPTKAKQPTSASPRRAQKRQPEKTPAVNSNGSTMQASTPTPVLVPSLSPTEREAALQSIKVASQRSRSVLARAARTVLTPEQSETVSRIRALLQQSENSTATDLVTARGYAERADLLSQDLARNLP